MAQAYTGLSHTLFLRGAVDKGRLGLGRARRSALQIHRRSARYIPPKRLECETASPLIKRGSQWVPGTTTATNVSSVGLSAIAERNPMWHSAVNTTRPDHAVVDPIINKSIQ